LAWCPLSKIQRIEFLIVTNGSINPWFEIILWNYWHTLCYRIENNDRLCHLSIVAWKWIVIAQVEGFFHLRWIKMHHNCPIKLIWILLKSHWFWNICQALVFCTMCHVYPPSFPSFIRHNMYKLLFFGNFWCHFHVYLTISLLR